VGNTEASVSLQPSAKMGVRIPRKKRRVGLLSLLYRVDRLLPLSERRKLKLYLDLEWIFDRLAMESSFRYYPPEAHPHRRFANSFLLRRLAPDMRVLDLGCAKGDVARVLARHVRRVVGVDHDAAAIAIAKKRYQLPNLSFVHGDALEYLQGGDEPFDVLVLSHILEHLDGPEGFIERFAPHFNWFYIELPDFDKSYLNHYRLDLGSSLVYSDDDHVSEFDRVELQTLLKRAGLEVVDAEYRFGLQRLWCRKA
jgi:SAM-dependent methyltransferase